MVYLFFAIIMKNVELLVKIELIFKSITQNWLKYIINWKSIDETFYLLFVRLFDTIVSIIYWFDYRFNEMKQKLVMTVLARMSLCSSVPPF